MDRPRLRSRVPVAVEIERGMERSLPPPRPEQRPRATVTVEAGTAEDADLRPPVDQEGEGDRVVIAAEKALGPVDRIEGPRALPGRVRRTSTDSLEHRVDRRQAEGLQQRQELSAERLSLGRAEGVHVLLGDDRIAGEGSTEGAADEGLGRIVGDGHRRAVRLLERGALE